MAASELVCEQESGSRIDQLFHERELGLRTDNQSYVTVSPLNSSNFSDFSDPVPIGFLSEDDDTVLSDEEQKYIMQDHDTVDFVSGITVRDTACF